jgi:FkbM family methyltransferase
MGKQKRNEYLKEKGILMSDFLPERAYLINNLKVMLRKGSKDFHMFCLRREEEISDYIKIYENETFVDIGANVGFYALKIAKENKNKAINVIAIEAHPENYKALCKNIELNKLSNIKAINKAVSDNKGIVTMYERKSVNRVQPEWYTIQQSISGVQLDKSHSIQIESDTLDNILDGNKADFIKIDIEGAEVIALKGAEKTLKKLRKIIVEIHENNFDKIKQILETNNFETETIINKIEKSEGFVIGIKKDIASKPS